MAEFQIKNVGGGGSPKYQQKGYFSKKVQEPLLYSTQKVLFRLNEVI